MVAIQLKKTSKKRLAKIVPHLILSVVPLPQIFKNHLKKLLDLKNQKIGWRPAPWLMDKPNPWSSYPSQDIY